MDLLDKLHHWFSSIHLNEDKDKVYVAIRRGDTLGQIAQEFTGDAGRWEELRPLNSNLQQCGAEYRIQPGDKLHMPANWLKPGADC